MLSVNTWSISWYEYEVFERKIFNIKLRFKARLVTIIYLYFSWVDVCKYIHTTLIFI